MSGRIPRRFLGAARGHPEAGDDLVEDKDRPVLVAELAQGRQKLRVGLHQAHVAGNGLNDDGGHLVADARHQVVDGREVVVGHRQGVGGGLAGDPSAAGDPQGGHPRAGVGEKRIGVAVVAAGKLDRQIAAGEAACHPQGAHGRLRARVDQAQLRHAGHQGQDLLGQIQLAHGGGAKAGAVVGGLQQRLEHGRGRVAEG